MVKRIKNAIKRRRDPNFRRMEERAIKYKWKGFTLEFKEEVSKVHSSEYGNIYLRNEGSDFNVFEQVLYRKEYYGLCMAAIDNGIHPKTIIDAGANIGLTSKYFFKQFPDAKVYAIEPDKENVKCVKRNLYDEMQTGNFILFEGALWHQNTNLSIDYSFGDGTNWARAVKEEIQGNNDIEGIDLKSFFVNYGITIVDIFKMDIEGTEEKIFVQGADYSFLNSIKVIGIEIHGHLNCREQIQNVLHEHGFIIFQDGPTTIGVNSVFVTF
jgi:FkbM family methyltransferase